MSILSSRFVRLLKSKWGIVGICIVVIIIIYWYSHRSSAPVFEAAPVTIGNVSEIVSVTGTVSPLNKADLAFQKSGVIAKIAVKVGDTVKKGDLIAALDSAGDAAAVASAQATLDDLNRGLRPQEYAVDVSNVNAASTTLSNAQKDAINAFRDGYVKTQSALVNYADNFFSNPESANPTININTQSSTQQIAINNERLVVSSVLAQWKSDSDAASVNNASSLISKAEGYLLTIKSYMSDLSVIVNGLSVGNSGMSQTAINSTVTTMNTALSTLTQAINSVSAADTELKNATAAYTQATNQFALQEAGSSIDAIAAQAAKVAQAEAVLSDDSILSPIDGLITKADPNVGEFAAAGQSGFAVQSAGEYKIEAYVPEADIAKVAVGDTANVTLDAYGSDVYFPASVSMIDPAETVLEGVPTYKVTLLFTQPDTRIRSGMTANTDILTHEVDNVLTVPTRAIITTIATTTDDIATAPAAKTVRVVNADGKSYTSVSVVVGLKGSSGTTQIISGVTEGQRVVTYVK